MNDKLKEEHDAYIAKAKERGDNVLTYTAPCCRNSTEDRAPKVKGEQWDSLVTCYHCGERYMKIARRDKISGFIPEGV